MWLELLLLAVAAFAAFYLYMTRNYKHFTKLGIPQDEPKFPFGTALGEIMARKKSIHQIMLEQYKK